MEPHLTSGQYPLINYLDTASDLVPNEDSAVTLQPPNTTTSTDSSATETLASTTSAAAANEVGPISDIQK